MFCEAFFSSFKNTISSLMLFSVGVLKKISEWLPQSGKCDSFLNHVLDDARRASILPHSPNNHEHLFAYDLSVRRMTIPNSRISQANTNSHQHPPPSRRPRLPLLPIWTRPIHLPILDSLSLSRDGQNILESFGEMKTAKTIRPSSSLHLKSLS